MKYFSPVEPLITNASLFGNCVRICRSKGSSEKRRLFGQSSQKTILTSFYENKSLNLLSSRHFSS